MSVTEITFKKKKTHFICMEFFIKYKYNLKNTIQFFSQTGNRQCLKLRYDQECGKNILKFQNKLEAPPQSQNLQ
jgi:hypothetical protein